MRMKGIKHLPLYFGSLSAITLALGAPSAVAQELHNHDICRNVTTFGPEQLGDRDGHSLTMAQDSCETVEGVTKGAVWHELSMLEWDGTKAKVLSGYGVGRKAGATTTYQDAEGTVELIVTDGKVTGWTGSGHAPVTMATGDWASFNGKTWFWTGKSTGPYTFEINSTLK
jgi:quercetin dioxygenase-like cupin family protein